MPLLHRCVLLTIRRKRNVCFYTLFLMIRIGYDGPKCQTCADDHYNYPLCTKCVAEDTCSGHGVCNSTTGTSI
jgi:hypothetical protein